MLVYSRPKGEYKGDMANHVLVDFQLVNDKLAADKDHVHIAVTGPGIDGEKAADATHLRAAVLPRQPAGRVVLGEARPPRRRRQSAARVVELEHALVHHRALSAAGRGRGGAQAMRSRRARPPRRL